MINNSNLLDSKFQVQVLSKTERPNLLCYLAMHQDYSESFVWKEFEKLSNYSEQELGNRIVRNCVNKNHWGILEHPIISFNAINFPHSVMVQARTHRIGCCLSGDIKICFGHRSLSSKEKYYEEELSTLARLWHKGRKHQPTKNDADYMKRQISNRQILVLDTNTNQLVGSHITNIYCNGEKDLYEVTTVEGHKIKATLEHQFWTNQGWLRLKDFSSSTQVTTVGYQGKKQTPSIIEFSEHELSSEKWKRIPDYPLFEVSTLGRVRSYASKGGRGNPRCDIIPTIRKLSKSKEYLFTSVFNHSVDKSVYHRQNVHELVLNTFCPKPQPNLECRHLNGNSYDNRLFNLQWGTSKCNSGDNLVNNTHACNRGRFVAVASILPCGKEQTYDIEVAHPCHNFLGNGVVVHNSFDCQSQRYTGKRILKLNKSFQEIEKNPNYLPEKIFEVLEKVFYFRPIGYYLDREGNKYFYSQEERKKDILFTKQAVEYYAHKVENQGYAPEHARDLLTQNIRQHFVVSFNARSLLHFCDLRLPKDAQLEIGNLASLMFEKFSNWMPEVADFYYKKRLGKNLLAP